MTKTTINGVQTFRPDVKANYKPAIVDSFMDDTGEKILVLDNGRETTETRYNALWMPCKGIVNWKGRGENPDKTKAWRK
jgi:hypothetical protein